MYIINNVCELALSYDITLYSDLALASFNYENYLNFCENGYDRFILKQCTDTLNQKYYECVFDNEPKNENEFYYQCLIFTEEHCQQFYHEPLSEECSMLKKTNSYLFLDPFYPKWQYYNENCQKIIDSRRITKSIESTTTKSEETTTSNSNQPTSTNSKKNTTTKSVKPIKKVLTTKLKKIKTTKIKKVKTTKKLVVIKKPKTTKKNIKKQNKIKEKLNY